MAPTIAHALRYTEKIQQKGGGTILNILGEHHDTIGLVETDLQKYRNLIDAVAKKKEKGKFNAAISIKPSQFGLYIEDMAPEEREGYTRERMWEIVDAATRNGIHVEMDIEKSQDHQFTYDLFKDFARRLTASNRPGMLAVAVQANYKGAVDRLKELMSLDPETYGPLKFRLVKGIYTKAKGDKLAISEETEMIRLYHALVETALSNKLSHHTIAIASHREDIIAEGGDEIQMLKASAPPCAQVSRGRE
ncbi:MAG: proline dehydrogenase family protein [Candidatus Micrarchaeota archaeon]